MSSLGKQMIEYKPIPPGQKLVDFFPFFRQLKKLQNSVVKSFGVRRGICPRKDGWGRKSKANLDSTESKLMFQIENWERTWVAT